MSVPQNLVVRFFYRLAQVASLSFCAVVFVAALSLYVAVSGGDARPLRAVVRVVGNTFAGQRSEHIATDVQLFPDTHRLSAATTVTLRSLEEQRPRFFFLFNPLLKLRSVRVVGGAKSEDVAVYRLSWLLFLEPQLPVAKDEGIQVRFEYEGTFPSTPPEAIPTEINPDNVMLGAEAFWFPFDAQSFFTADVRVTLPRALTLAHASRTTTQVVRGDQQVVSWTSTRPLAAIPLVAGRFRTEELHHDDGDYRLYLADDVELDSTAVLDHMAHANRFLVQRLGPSGFDTVAVYVSRNLRRGVNYGNGLIGLSLRYFRGGDNGYALLAHEIAHNWWGATVAEQWLNPASGGQWIVEGWAELFSLLATEEAFGVDALTQRLAAAHFDPERQRAVRDMSMLDNVLNEAVSRDTIYRKGAYVALQLCQKAGRDRCYEAMRKLVETQRYRQATDADVEKVFEEALVTNLQPWSQDWLRSDVLADLQLVADPQGGFTVHSQGKARVDAQEFPLWVFASDSAEPTVLSTHLGEHYDLQPNQHAILDPQLSFPDVIRRNNRFPAQDPPLHVVPREKQVLLTSGEPYAWSAHTITWLDGGTVKQKWELARAALQPPQWFPDGSQVLISYSDARRTFPTILVLSSDGSRRTLGSGNSPAVAADGSVLTARQEQILRLSSDGSESVVVRRPGWILDQPLPSPDASRFAYLAAQHNSLEVHVAEPDGSGDRVLFTWDRDRTLLRWAPAGDKLYAVLGGDWDWQLWEVPLDASATRILVRDTTSIGDVAVSPNGSHIAITATPEKGYPLRARELFVLSVAGEAPRHIPIPDANLDRVAWEDSTTLLVAGSRSPSGQAWTLPQQRFVKAVSLADGTTSDRF